MPSGPVVLVVDDHEDTLDLYAVQLRLLGFQVLTASDARTAIRRAVEVRPAAVVMDIVMPAMDGCEAARHIKAAHGRVPIIAVTATPGLLAAGERDLFAGVFGKPLKPAVLAEALRHVLNGGEPER